MAGSLEAPGYPPHPFGKREGAATRKTMAVKGCATRPTPTTRKPLLRFSLRRPLPSGYHLRSSTSVSGTVAPHSCVWRGPIAPLTATLLSAAAAVGQGQVSTLIFSYPGDLLWGKWDAYSHRALHKGRRRLRDPGVQRLAHLPGLMDEVMPRAAGKQFDAEGQRNDPAKKE